jgi:biopolymer transport protein ExbD
MRSPEHLKPQGGRFNLTPIIDMVFLLIIFFIVSNNMIQQDTAIRVDLPEAESGTLPQDPQMKRLTVSIPGPGRLYVGTEVVEKERLRQLLAECRRDWGAEAELQIRTNRSVPYGEIKPILQMAAANGILRISFAVKER